MTWGQLEKDQDKVVQILKNSIVKQRLAHAYILEGGKGTGKMALALQLAKAYFCKELNQANPCQHCVDCKRITSGNHPDVHLISPDGQSIKKEQVKHLQKEFSYKGMESRKKVYIIEFADKMTASAANSLLKFLEEPASPTIAILLTEQIHQMLNTILSRSQVLSLAPLNPTKLIEFYEENGISKVNAKLLVEITSNLDEALQLCQEDWIVQARNLVIQLTEEVYKRPHQMFFTLQEKWLSHFSGKEQVSLSLDLLLLWYRDLLYTFLDEKQELIFIDQEERLSEEALYTSEEKISRQMLAIFDAKRHLSANVQPQLLMEKLLLRLQEG